MASLVTNWLWYHFVGDRYNFEKYQENYITYNVNKENERGIAEYKLPFFDDALFEITILENFYEDFSTFRMQIQRT